MALLAAGSALVAGSSLENDMQEMQVREVRVLRAFYYNRKPIEVSKVLELPKIFAAEMVAAKKAQYTDGEAKTAETTAAPATVETRKRDSKN
jgi:oligoribonuclease (3'-5' exoribonuclease)